MGGTFLFLKRATVSDVRRLFGRDMKLVRVLDMESRWHAALCAAAVSVVRITADSPRPAVPASVARLVTFVGDFADGVLLPPFADGGNGNDFVFSSALGTIPNRYLGPVPFPASDPANGFLPRMVRAQSFGLDVIIAFAFPCLDTNAGNFYLGLSRDLSSGNPPTMSSICGTPANSTFIIPTSLNLTLCTTQNGAAFPSSTFSSSCMSMQINPQTQIVSAEAWSSELIQIDANNLAY